MRGELAPLVKLAGPVVLAEVGAMGMGLVDTIMVGPLGPAAVAATGLGSGVFTAVAIFGLGLMLGLDSLVSRAYGAGRLDECLRWLRHGVCLALLVAPLATLITWGAYLTMDRWGLDPEIRVLAGPYLRVIGLSALPWLLSVAFRRYLQGLHIVAPVMVALVSANLVNAGANWLLIYGHWGFPALGVEGSAWATTLARTYMAVFLFIAIRRMHARRGALHPDLPFAFDPSRLMELLRLGIPAASQLTLEVGVFALVTGLAARLDPVSSAAHQIALNIAGVLFMIPLGLSSATAVRVGHALGARDPHRAISAGWTALALGGSVTAAIAVAMFASPLPMLRVFTADVRVLAIGSTLLGFAAAFQLFDGTQAVITGALRGLGDTRSAMVINAIGHWALGLPIGYALCFRFGWGVTGLWVGLTVGLIFVSIVLAVVWVRRTRRIDLLSLGHAVAVPDLL